MNSFGLCRSCIYYRPVEKVCVRSTIKIELRNYEINYSLADSVRLDEKKCGLEAKWFKKNQNK